MRLARCVFRQNGIDQGPGSAIGASGGVTIADSTFDGQDSARNRPAIDVAGDLTLTGSTITNNVGGDLHTRGEATVQGCTFAHNSSGGGGAINSEGTTRVINTVFFANLADGSSGIGESMARGGAIFTSGDLHVSQSTLLDNVAASFSRGQTGGAICVAGGSTVVESSILWASSPQEVEGPPW